MISYRRRNRGPRTPVVVADTFGDPDLEKAMISAGQRDWRSVADLMAGPADLDQRAYRSNVLSDAVEKDAGWADAWLRARPGDASALLVRGRGEIARAWAARGNGWADSVTDDGWRTFFQRLHVADELTEAAVAAAPQDLAPRVARLQVGIGLQIPGDEFRARWNAVSACHPLSRTAHSVALQYWSKKWYGSHEQMYAFARGAAAAAPGTWATTLPLRAHIEYALRVQHDGDDVDLVEFWERSPQMHADLDAALRWARNRRPATTYLDLLDVTLLFYCLAEAERWSDAKELLVLLDGHAADYPYYYWGHVQEKITEQATRALR